MRGVIAVVVSVKLGYAFSLTLHSGSSGFGRSRSLYVMSSASIDKTLSLTRFDRLEIDP
jgi:hypothetical protein